MGRVVSKFANLGRAAHGSKAKIFFQSFFMLTTAQLFFLATATCE
jgi:hypothetical protein